MLLSGESFQDHPSRLQPFQTLCIETVKVRLGTELRRQNSRLDSRGLALYSKEACKDISASFDASGSNPKQAQRLRSKLLPSNFQASATSFAWKWNTRSSLNEPLDEPRDRSCSCCIAA